MIPRKSTVENAMQQPERVELLSPLGSFIHRFIPKAHSFRRLCGDSLPASSRSLGRLQARKRLDVPLNQPSQYFSDFDRSIRHLYTLLTYTDQKTQVTQLNIDWQETQISILSINQQNTKISKVFIFNMSGLLFDRECVLCHFHTWPSLVLTSVAGFSLSFT